MKTTKIFLILCLAIIMQLVEASPNTYTSKITFKTNGQAIMIAPRQELYYWDTPFDINNEWRFITPESSITLEATDTVTQHAARFYNSAAFLVAFPAEIKANNTIKYIVAVCGAENTYDTDTDNITQRVSCGRFGFNQFTKSFPINEKVESYQETYAFRENLTVTNEITLTVVESNGVYYLQADNTSDKVKIDNLGRSSFFGDFECVNNSTTLYSCIKQNMFPYQYDFHPGKVTFNPVTITSPDNVPLAIGYGTPGKWEYGNVVGRSTPKNETMILREAYNEVNDNAIYSFKIALPAERTIESDGTYISYVQTVCSLQSLRGSNAVRAVGAINCGYKNTVEAVASRTDRLASVGVAHNFDEGGDILWLGTDMSVSLDNNNRYKLVMSCRYNTQLTGPQACPSSTEYVDKLNSGTYKTFKCKLDDNISTCVDREFN